MTPAEKTLRELPALRVQAVLQELAQLAGKSGDRLPLVTLFLASGARLQGRVLAFRHDRDGPAILLEEPGPDPRAPQADALYVDPQAVQGVTVHEAWRFAPALSQGRIDVDPARPAPTKLDLSRRARDLSASLTHRLGRALEIELAWTSLPVPSEEVLKGLEQAVLDVATALGKIMDDDFGRSELARCLGRVRLVGGPEPQVTRDGECVTVALAFDRGRAGRLDATALVVAIGAVV